MELIPVKVLHSDSVGLHSTSMVFLRFFQLFVEPSRPEFFEPPLLRVAHVPPSSRALPLGFSFALAFHNVHLRLQLKCLFYMLFSLVTQPARFDLLPGEAAGSLCISGLPAR